MHFQEIADFIEAEVFVLPDRVSETVLEAGRAKGGVVVHCAAGVSRASTSCMAQLGCFEV